MSRTPTIPPVVDQAFLDAHPNAVLADVRWYLDGRDAAAIYRAGHIPGAVFVDLETALSDHSQPKTAGRHPLPSPEHFAAAMSALGIGDDTTVIAYDDTGGMTAGRLAVMLRMLGRDAAILNGGINAWDGALETGDGATPTPATFTAQPWPTDRLATVDDVANAAIDGTPLLDARSAERYHGAVAVDPRPGHIPGATSAPCMANVDGAGRMLPIDTLRDRFTQLGLTPTPDPVRGFQGGQVTPKPTNSQGQDNGEG
ncbi:MAG TPA: rhodanese-like domain-containing protein, partial [Ilumatobacteraceae bacterium]|nr:rhodanese-like domain-containing protein [Ilumatobacteraceae bacterium]